MSEDTFKLVWEVADGYVSSGRPQDLELWLCDLAAYDSEEEVREAMKEPIGAIIDCVTRTLEKAEPELAADLVENGIVLAGGGALLLGMDTVLSNATGLDVAVTDFSGCREYLFDVGMHPIKWHNYEAFYNTQVKGDYGEDAYPDEDHIAEIMTWASNNRDKVRERGKQLSQIVHKRWTWQRPVNQLKNILPKYES